MYEFIDQAPDFWKFEYYVRKKGYVNRNTYWPWNSCKMITMYDVRTQHCWKPLGQRGQTWTIALKCFNNPRHPTILQGPSWRCFFKNWLWQVKFRRPMLRIRLFGGGFEILRLSIVFLGTTMSFCEMLT